RSARERRSPQTTLASAQFNLSEKHSRENLRENSEKRCPATPDVTGRVDPPTAAPGNTTSPIVRTADTEKAVPAHTAAPPVSRRRRPTSRRHRPPSRARRRPRTARRQPPPRLLAPQPA